MNDGKSNNDRTTKGEKRENIKKKERKKGKIEKDKKAMRKRKGAGCISSKETRFALLFFI